MIHCKSSFASVQTSAKQWQVQCMFSIFSHWEVFKILQQPIFFISHNTPPSEQNPTKFFRWKSMSSMICFKHRNMESRSPNLFSECSKILIAFTKLFIVLPVPISKKQMNFSKLKMFEIFVTSSVSQAYPPLCFIWSTSFSLTTLTNTRISF